jgi:DHA1 family bicyclomycin/chloramphenicol resistance-like MFS transporter
MELIKENHQRIRTILSFALIPLSGFATDIYVPSLPSMASQLNVSNSAVQLTLVLFMASSGISQLFVGSLLDSFGRFRLGVAAMIVFALASFTIALSHDIYVIYAMRILHGITVAMIVVGKRAYFVDTFSGDKLKHYTSLFSIVWATAPIVAPFLGGYLQASFGWQSNFYFLGIFTLVIVALELGYGGESLKTFHPFKLKSILEVYTGMIRTADFSVGLVILALCYSMLVVFGMTSPFIIEHVFHYSPVITGYCALLSGVALMAGGIISKTLIRQPLTKKIVVAVSLQLLFAGAMIASSGLASNLFTLMPFVLVVHLLAGFIFNNIFSYCLGRFSKNAGVASGVTGGSMYVMTSILSYGLVNIVPIRNQGLLGGADLTLAVLIYLAFALFRKAQLGYGSNLSKSLSQTN